jgi:four helix bundle protein
MALKFEELEILQKAGTIADSIWRDIVPWEPFVKDVVGGQLARAADSIGANIAEAFGRFHYGEKVQFLYYARGSLYETKYWINRTQARQLMSVNQGQNYAKQLSELARQLNAFISNIKAQQRSNQPKMKTVSEFSTTYMEDQPNDTVIPMFTEDEIKWLETIPNTQ